MVSPDLNPTGLCSEDHSLKNMSICQFTDLSIYLDNSSSNTELSSENTVKELYIDNDMKAIIDRIKEYQGN